MGNEASSPRSTPRGDALPFSKAEAPLEGVPLPLMVVMVNDVIWRMEPDHDTEDVFCSLCLDGKEIGRIVSYPSQLHQVQNSKTSSHLTLRFFAGAGANAFMRDPDAGLPQPQERSNWPVQRPKVRAAKFLAELVVPLYQLVKYGAPLYTSMWLGLPAGETCARAEDFGEALQSARNPEVPKVNITVYRPENVIRMGNSTPVPDIGAMLQDEGQWDLCVAPAQSPVSATEQVRGLVSALNLANANSLALSSQGFTPRSLLDSHLLKIQEQGGAAVDLQLELESIQKELATSRKELAAHQQELDATRKDSTIARLERADMQIKVAREAEEVQARHQQEISSLRTELFKQIDCTSQASEAAQNSQAELQALMAQLEGSMALNRDLEMQVAQTRFELDSLRTPRKEQEVDNQPLSEVKKLEISLAESEAKHRRETLARRQAELQIVREQQESQAKYLAAQTEVGRLQKSMTQQKEQAEAEREKLQKLLAQAEEQSHNLQLEFVRVQKSLTQSESPREHDAASPKSESSLSFQLGSLEQSLQNKIAELEEKHKIELARSYTEVEALREEARQGSEELMKTCQKLQATRDSAAKELQTTKDNYAKELQATRDSSAQELQATKDSAAKELQATKDRAAEELQTIKDRAAGFDELQAELLAAKADLSTLQRDHSEQVVNDRTARFDELQAELQATKSELATLQKVHEKRLMKNRAAGFDELQAELKATKSELSALRKDHSEQLIENARTHKELETTKSDAAKERESMKSELLSLQSSQSTRQQEAKEKESLEFQLMQAKQTNGILQDEVKQVSAEVEDLRAQAARKDELERYLDRMISEADVQAARKGELERNLERMISEAAEQAARKDELEKDLERMISEVDALRLERTSFEAKNEVAEMSNAMWLNKVIEFRQEIFAARNGKDVQRQPKMRSLSPKSPKLSPTREAEQEFDMLREDLRQVIVQERRDNNAAPANVDKQKERIIEELSAALKQEQEAHSNEAKELNAALRAEQEAHKYNEGKLKAALKQEVDAHSKDVTSLDSLVESLKLENKDNEQRIQDLEATLRSVYPDAHVLQMSPTGGPGSLSDGLNSASASAAGSPFPSNRSLSSFLTTPVLASRRSLTDDDEGSTVQSTTSELGDKVGNMSKENKWLLRMFRRLLFEKFSHFAPEELHKALKLETRPSTMLRVEVEKVLKSYKAYQKSFGMRKAFQKVDVPRAGLLDAPAFEKRMGQIFSMDAALSSHIFRLLLEQAGNDTGVISEEQFAQSLGERLVKATSPSPRPQGRESDIRAPANYYDQPQRTTD